MKLKIICLFFAYLKSSKNIYDNLLDIVKQKIETKDYYLIDLEKKYYVFKACLYAKGIVFGGYMRGASGSNNSFFNLDVSEYNTAEEAIQAICDCHLSRNFNISKKSPIFYKIGFASVFDHDIRLKLENFFYNKVEPDFIARLYDSNKQKQIRELCLFFSRNKMIDLDFCFSLEKYSFKDTIQCFEEENKMKFFFPVKLRNLILFFKIEIKDLYTVEEQYTSEIIKLHKNNNDNNICTEICTLMCKIFTFSDFLLNSKLLNDVNNDEKKLPRQFLLYNFEKIFFNVLIIKKAIFFKTLSRTFYYSCNNHLEIEGNCQYISEETYQDCIEIWNLYMKAKNLDFFKYKIIFHKFKNENLLNHLLYKICESPGSASYIILMQILGHYNILNVNEIIFLTQNLNDDKRFRIIIFLENFFTKEKLSKIHFVMTAESEEINNLLYTLIYKEAEEYFSIYKKDDVINIEFFNDLQKFSDLYLCLNNKTLYNFYSILLENLRFIIASGKKTLPQLFESIALLTNVDVRYSIGEERIYFNKVEAKKMFQILNIDNPENLENYVESLIK